jgi:hypothetical protein
VKSVTLYLPVVTMLAVVGALHGQSPVLLPPDAVVMESHRGGSAEFATAIEESGLVPYRGHSCDDVSSSFREVKGRQLGNNEWAQVTVNVLRYGAGARFAFDQNMQFASPADALREAEAEARSGTDPHGSRIDRTIRNGEAPHGRMLLIRDAMRCIESKYQRYDMTDFESFAVVGTTIVRIKGQYNSADPAIAEKVHAAVVAKVGSLR